MHSKRCHWKYDTTSVVVKCESWVKMTLWVELFFSGAQKSRLELLHKNKLNACEAGLSLEFHNSVPFNCRAYSNRTLCLVWAWPVISAMCHQATTSVMSSLQFSSLSCSREMVLSANGSSFFFYFNIPATFVETPVIRYLPRNTDHTNQYPHLLHNGWCVCFTSYTILLWVLFKTTSFLGSLSWAKC